VGKKVAGKEKNESFPEKMKNVTGKKVLGVNVNEGTTQSMKSNGGGVQEQKGGFLGGVGFEKKKCTDTISIKDRRHWELALGNSITAGKIKGGTHHPYKKKGKGTAEGLP